MSNLEEGVALEEFPEVDEEQIEDNSSYEDTVNKALGDMKKDDDGKWTFPNETPEHVKYSAMAEKRRRDTQAALTKEQQSTKSLKSERDAFKQKLSERVQLNLSEDETTELTDLKTTDPDAWRAKLNEHTEKAKEELEEEIAETSIEAEGEVEVERRTKLLKTFQKDNPELTLNDEVFENELPPRITKRLDKGEISFDEFLAEAKDFLTRGVTTKRKSEDKEPNLSDVGGGGEVTETEIEQDIVTSYDKEIY